MSGDRLVIKVIGVTDVENAPNVTALLDEYASYGLPELPHPRTKFAVYHELEDKGVIHTIGAYYDDTLVGFISVLRPVSTHYGYCLAVTESFFVAKEYRATGAGKRLLNAARSYAKEIGSPGLLTTLPPDANEEALKRVGIRLVNKVFFVEVGNE